MSDFTSVLSGLGDAFGSLADKLVATQEVIEERIVGLQAEVAAMRGALEACRWDLEMHGQEYEHRTRPATKIAVDAALAGDAGKGWVSPEQIRAELDARDQIVRSRIGSEIAALYAKMGGMGNAAEVFVAVLKIVNSDLP